MTGDSLAISTDELMPPAPQTRPLFARFLWERNIQYRPAAKAIGKSHEYVRLICLPFEDNRRITPDPATAERIRAWTQGAVPPESFNAPVVEAPQS